MKFKIEPGKGMEKTLRSEIVDILNGVNNDLNKGLKEVAHDTKVEGDRLADSRLHSTRQQYQAALSYQQLGPNIFSVTLNADSVHLEEGYASFDMKPGMLNSNAIVSKGKRAGEKWVRKSKDGYRYAIVPMEQGRSGSGPGRPSPNAQVQIENPVTRGADGKLSRQGSGPVGVTTQGSLKADIANMLKSVKMGKVVKDSNGDPVIGRTATLTFGKDQSTINAKMYDGSTRSGEMGTSLGGSQNEASPLLNGLVVTQFKKGNKVERAYMTFRVVSENPNAKGKWIHPGYQGAKIFKDLERFAEDALVKMVDKILSPTG